MQMKATKDFFILDSEVRLHDELGGGVVCVALARCDNSVLASVSVLMNAPRSSVSLSATVNLKTSRLSIF